MDSLAVLERGYLYPSPASNHGIESECPFCVARHIDKYRPGDLAVMLQGLEAGRILRYTDAQQIEENLYEWIDEPGKSLRLLREHWLTLPIEFLTVPFWLPKLELRYCFIIDELCVWACNECSAGERFHWNSDVLTEIVRTCWRKRIPVEPTEISKVMLAHGMPELYQERTENLFQFGMRTLIASEGRKPLKKLRNNTFAEQQLYEIWKSR